MSSIEILQQIAVAGILATAVLDLWQRLLQAVFGVPAANWAMVGRWISHIPKGRLIHRPIGASDAVPHETLTGWITHYATGLIYAAAYLAFVRLVLQSEPTFTTALGFGLVTVAAPWFLLQPGMGLGVMARKAPSPGRARVQSLASHAAFGFGLYLATLTF